MLPVDFTKWPCRPVEFKGQGPRHWECVALLHFSLYLLCQINGLLHEDTGMIAEITLISLHNLV